MTRLTYWCVCVFHEDCLLHCACGVGTGVTRVIVVCAQS